MTVQSSTYLKSLLAVFFIAISSCGKNKPEPAPQPQPAGCKPTYTTNIKTIVNAKCSVSGCHNGSANIVNFGSYAPLKERADNGRIRSYIFELKIMPPASASQLTDAEKDVIKCWLDNDAPEN